MPGAESLLLVVDDEEIFLRELAESLHDRSLSTLTANSGDSAIKIVMEHPGISVVLLDLRMPVMDGVQAAEIIQKIRPDIAIVFLSGFDSQEFRLRASERRVRAECWMNKGEDVEAMIEKIYEHVNRILIRQSFARCKAVIEDVHRIRPFSAEQKQLLEEAFTGMLNQLPLSLAQKTMHLPSAGADTVHVVEINNVLDRIAVLLSDILPWHEDPAHRELVWQRIQRICEEELWRAVEAATIQKNAKQLAVMMKLAIRRIAAPQLTTEHIHALYLCLERLRSERIERSDVSICKERFREAGIETLPSFRKVLQNWDELYDREDDEK